MSRYGIPRLSVLAMLVLGGFTLWAASCASTSKRIEPPASPNLLQNGGFEVESVGRDEPKGWFATRVPRTSEFVTFDWDDQVHHGGSHSVSIAIHEDHPEDKVAYNWTCAVDGCENGCDYVLTGWVKTEKLNGPAFIVIQCWDTSRQEMLGFATTQTEYDLTGSLRWTPVRVEFEVPEDTAEVRIRAGIGGPACAGGKVWFDDLGVRRISG